MSVDGFYAVYRPAVFDVDTGIAHAFQVAGEGELFFGCRCAGGEQAWAKQLTNKEAMKYTPQNIFKESSNWYPYK